MIDTTEIEYRLCRIIKRVLFLSCRFPVFKDEYIRQKIDKPGTPREELECYMSSCTRTGRRRAILLVLVYFTYCFKNAYIPYISFKTFDYDNLESNIKIYEQQQQQQQQQAPPLRATSLKQFACLWTNCSRLSPGSLGDPPGHQSLRNHYTTHLDPHQDRFSSPVSDLAQDVVLLPLFALCNPLAEVLYTPVLKLDSVGILISAAVCLNVLLLGSYTTIQQFIAPAHNEMIMYICAPLATAQMWRSRASQLFFDLTASFHNFRHKPVWRRKRANSIRRFQAQWQPQLAELGGSRGVARGRASHPLTDFVDGGGASQISNLPSDHYERVTTRVGSGAFSGDHGPLAAGSGRLRGETDQFEHISIRRHGLSFEGKTRAQMREITDGCMPITRTEWWRPLSVRIFNHTLLLAMSLIGLVGLGAAFFIAHRSHQKSRALASTAREIERQNCSLWRTGPTRAATSALINLDGNPDDDADDDGGKLKPLEIDFSDPISSLAGDHVSLDQLNFRWTPFAMLLGMVNLLPGFSVSILFAYYWACLSELSVWLAELRMFLVASLVVCKWKLSPSLREPTTGADAAGFRAPWIPRSVRESLVAGGNRDGAQASGHPEEVEVDSSSQSRSVGTNKFYSMKLLRRRFQSECWLMSATWFVVRRIEQQVKLPGGGGGGGGGVKRRYELGALNSKSVDQFHFRHFLAQLSRVSPERADKQRRQQELQQREHTAREPRSQAGSMRSLAVLRLAGSQRRAANNLSSELECMEQIYVNFRMFVEHVSDMTPSVKVVLAITYLLNYGLVFIAIMCSRKMATLRLEPLFIIIFGWFISNYLIFLAANFHADAKKLQPLLWSIVAQLTSSDDLRVQHMRYLWTKQVQMLDDAGGLALTAFRLRVTYVNIIQLALGTATIIVISIRPG